MNTAAAYEIVAGRVIAITGTTATQSWIVSCHVEDYDVRMKLETIISVEQYTLLGLIISVEQV